MKNDDFFAALKKKTKDTDNVPHGFDVRFQEKFDARFKKHSKWKLKSALQLLGVPVLAMVLIGVFNIQPGNPEFPLNEEIVLTEDYADVAQNMDIIDLDDEEWVMLVEGDANEGG
jgi:hypothetical protein